MPPIRASILAWLALASTNAGWWQGRWSADMRWCSDASYPKRTVRLNTAWLEFEASGCRVLSQQQPGRTTAVVTARCRDEGEHVWRKVRFTLRRTPDGMALRDEAGLISKLHRCP